MASYYNDARIVRTDKEIRQIPSRENIMHPALNQLTQLPVAERLELVQGLWDSIADSKEQLPVQQWHREIATSRLAELDSQEKEFGLTREQVWEQVDQRRGL